MSLSILALMRVCIRLWERGAVEGCQKTLRRPPGAEKQIVMVLTTHVPTSATVSAHSLCKRIRKGTVEEMLITKVPLFHAFDLMLKSIKTQTSG